MFLLSVLLFSTLVSTAGFAAQITILHTNDLHSHFRPERSILELGGIARIKSAIDQIRNENPNSLLVDGGDWSEGNIYYNQGAGSETLKMMAHLGYDAAVVGNHDFLNGPDYLLDAINRGSRSMSLLAANVETKNYGRAEEFGNLIQPYVIKNIGGARVAFIGVTTYEFIYDGYFSPVKILSPIGPTQDLAASLKTQADAVVVISHNSLKLNEKLLKQSPDVDLIIGAHDHVKLTAPIVVHRDGRPDAWIVETGCWGQYLGRVDMQIENRNEAKAAGRNPVQLTHYNLIQMDSKIPDDSATLTKLTALESVLENHYGPIFEDDVATSEVELDRAGSESRMGNFATDAYLKTTQADLALDQIAFIYGELHQGSWRTVDLYNANPGIHNPITDKSWTVQTIDMTGKTLNWLLAFLFSSNQVAQMGIVSSSGLQMTYNPAFSTLSQGIFGTIWDANLYLQSLLGFKSTFDDASRITQDIRINGAPLDRSATYKVAAGGGIIQTITVINSLLPGTIPMNNLQDSGIESWRSMLNYAQALSTVTPANVSVGNRIRSRSPDLGLYYDDITFTPLRRNSKGIQAKISVKVTNFGATSSSGGSLKIEGNQNGSDLSKDPATFDLADAWDLSGLAPMESKTFETTVQVPKDRVTTGEPYSVTATVNGTGESNHSNDQATRWFSLDLL